jgi:hypothetical protein
MSEHVSDRFDAIGGSIAPVPLATKQDGGCGCGGSAGCGEEKSKQTANGDCGCADAGPEKQANVSAGRRRFLAGGVTVSFFATTLASRPAHAICNNLTMLYSPTASGNQIRACSSGKTPGFWAQHPLCWPPGICPSDTFSKWFGSTTFPYSSETLRLALCPPNGADNLAFQLAAGLLNAGAPQTQNKFGYGDAQAFADAVVAALNATSNNFSLVHDVVAQMNMDGSNLDSWCGNGGSSICSGTGTNYCN